LKSVFIAFYSAEAKLPCRQGKYPMKSPIDCYFGRNNLFCSEIYDIEAVDFRYRLQGNFSRRKTLWQGNGRGNAQIAFCASRQKATAVHSDPEDTTLPRIIGVNLDPKMASTLSPRGDDNETAMPRVNRRHRAVAGRDGRRTGPSPGGRCCSR
jgi:hypothetical protein